MASIKDLKTRITSVKNTQQTTKAMKMVSAAKLRRAQDAIAHQRPYAKRIGNLIRMLSALPEVRMNSPLVEGAVGEVEGAAKKVALVVVTSDRGLAGAFNGNVIKGAMRWVNANRENYETIELSFLGRKGNEYFRTRKMASGTYFSELGGKVSFVKAKKLSDVLVKRFLDGELQEVKFIYNEFKNAVTQSVRVEDFLPLKPEVPAQAVSAQVPVQEPIYIVKPDPSQVLEELLSKHFSAQAFRIMLESQAGEHGARMSAMENATKNAGEMIRKLTLQYNKQRQANITRELLEIISGSESQKVD